MKDLYYCRYFFHIFANDNEGGLAHQVERQVRNLKVAGSSPVSSTIHYGLRHTNGLTLPSLS